MSSTASAAWSLEIEVFAELKLADGSSLDEGRLDLGPLALLEADAEDLAVRPSFNFNQRFLAISRPWRSLIGMVAATGLILVLANVGIGLHDQFSPAEQQILHGFGAKRGQNPLLKSAGTTVVLVVFYFLALRFGLKRHLEMDLYSPGKVGPSSRLPARELVRLQSDTEMHQAEVRIVAFNFEQGLYQPKDQEGQEPRRFENKVRAVRLFEQKIGPVAAGQDAAALLEGEVDFGPVYQQLLPPSEPGHQTGIGVGWELQLFSDGCVDVRRGDSQVFEPASFRQPWQANLAGSAAKPS